MKHGLRGVLALAVLMAGVLVMWPGHSSAATSTPGFNVITSPLPIKLTTVPGKTVTTELRLKNQGNQPEGIKVGLMKFGATGDSGTPDLFSLSPSDSYASWVHFSPQQFVAQPNVWLSVTMTINIPANASLGYYLAVTFSPANLPGVAGAANLKGEVATLVLLDVRTANEKRTLDLVDFSTDHGLYEYLPVNFIVTFHNTGNIYLAPAGDIFIQRGSKAIDSITFNGAGGSVLPSANRQFTLSWTNGFPVFQERLVDGRPVEGKGAIPKENLKWDFTQIAKFRFGHYNAKLVAVYDNGSQDVPLEATVGFWVVPWKLLLILLVIVAIIGFGIFSFVRSLLRRTRGKVSHLQQRRHGQK